MGKYVGKGPFDAVYVDPANPEAAAEWLGEHGRIDSGYLFVRCDDDEWAEVTNGNWIIRNAPGSYGFVEDEAFRALFEPAREESGD
jgi:hypothetical protein